MEFKDQYYTLKNLSCFWLSFIFWIIQAAGSSFIQRQLGVRAAMDSHQEKSVLASTCHSLFFPEQDSGVCVHMRASVCVCVCVHAHMYALDRIGL
jgi:hypothetical protein